MRYLIPFCLLLLLSCKDDLEPEVISLEELTGETGSEELSDSTQFFDQTFVPSLINNFIVGQLSLYDTASHKKPHSIDRFGFGTQLKIEFTGKTKISNGKSNAIIPVAQLFYYTFSDTTKTKNAFYNWLDCFGKNCDVIKLNEDVEELKTAPMFTLVYDTCIVAVEYLCENEKNNWKSFQDSLISKFGKSYNYRIDVSCDGPLKWKQPIKN